MYYQCDGLSIGCSPSPPVAIIAVFEMEKKVFIYTVFVRATVCSQNCVLISTKIHFFKITLILKGAGGSS